MPNSKQYSAQPVFERLKGLFFEQFETKYDEISCSSVKDKHFSYLGGTEGKKQTRLENKKTM